LPVGVPAPGETGVTVAVNVTLWPDTVVPLPVRVVKVGDIPTLKGVLLDVLPRYSPVQPE
jgi:hypothetical protein